MSRLITFFKTMNARTYRIMAQNDELIWAEIFHDTIIGSTWLHNRTFSFGRWAIGYPTAYALYRVLDEFRPRSILEIGLGQSTRMISQYVSANEGVKHRVVDHDKEWAEFFSANFTLSENSEVIIKPWGYAAYKGEKVRIYDGLADELRGEKFDLIFIDGPWGADMHDYSRIDVLSLLPGCLSDSFVIIMHDCDRKGEANTFDEIKNILSSSGIGYSEGNYNGEKRTKLLCSSDWKYLASM